MDQALVTVTPQNAIARHETAQAAVAARAQAEVQARFAVAYARPRMIDQVRLDLLKECKRPSFAKVSRYSVPRGGKTITGWSIRFVEAAMRCMHNVDLQVTALYDDDEKRIVRCAVVDLETNATWSQEITVAKTVERRSVKQDQATMVIGTRKNSYGETVYLLPATEDDMQMKIGAQVSKVLRTLGLRVVPGDLLDEAEREVLKTNRDEDARDPDTARRELVDAYAAMGVKPDQLIDYLGGKPLDAIGHPELEELRGVFAVLREGTRWAELLAGSPHRGTTEEQKDEKVSAAAEKVKKKVEAMKAKREKPKAAAKPASAPPADGEHLEQEEPGAKE